MVETQTAFSVAVLIDELRSEDITVRLRSLDQIDFIARVLGPSRARDELLPFVMDMSDDEDEVLCVIASKLGTMVDDIGGPDYAFQLIRPLEQLAAVEEQCIRDKAIESLRQVCKALSKRALVAHFSPFVMRLSVSDWYISRVTACILAPEILLKDFNSDLFRQLCELTREDTPKVRRSAFSALVTVLPILPSTIFEDTCATLERCSRDEEDIVRMGAVEAAACLLSTSDRDQGGHAVAVATRMINAASDDPSWRVRNSLIDSSERLASICPSLGCQDLISLSLIKLVHDPDSEVRAAAVTKLLRCLHHLNESSAFVNILDSLSQASRDNADSVRLGLATDFCRHTNSVPAEQFIQFCLPIVLQLVRDESVAVRIRMLSSLTKLPEFIPAETYKIAFLPSLRELVGDKNWRVRKGLLQLLHEIAPSLSGMGYADEMLGWIEKLLSDTVYCVREAAGITLTQVCCGDKALTESAIPILQRIMENQNYLCRVTGLLAAKTLGLSTHDDETISLIFMAIKSCATDSVANVRLSFIRAATELSRHDSVVASRITPIISDMERDSDIDVRSECKRYSKTK